MRGGRNEGRAKKLVEELNEKFTQLSPIRKGKVLGFTDSQFTEQFGAITDYEPTKQVAV